MFSSDLFRWSDSVELLLAALLIAMAWVWRTPLQSRLAGFAIRTVWCMALLAALPVLLRLALLPHHPVPVPDIYDEFSHLLVADTLRHVRLANPAHPFHAFFETFFVLQTPTYSSIYPIGQGLVLAVGRGVFGLPWAGVVLATAAFCSLCYWMLRAWTTPGWALAGGLLAVFEFGPLNPWMNNYWGGALPAAAGCLVFGALPRMRQRPAAMLPAVLLGLGIALHLLARPFESIFLVVSVVLYRIPLGKSAAVAALVVLPAVAVTLLQNRAVTGNWTTLPYSLSQYQYGVPAALTFQQPPAPHLALTPQQSLDYRMQRAFLPGRETLSTYFTRLGYRVRFYRFFLLPPLYLALAAFLFRLREYRFAWVALTVVLFALGVNFFPAWQFHYVAAETCLFVLIAVVGLEQLSRFSPESARVLMLLCCVHFAFWYSMHVCETCEVSRAMRPYETWPGLDRHAERRTEVARRIAAYPGRLLVFAQYGPRHIFQEEWVWNEADINGARVIWARDLGPDENRRLIQYYPGRQVLLLDADVRPLPVLEPYAPPPAAPPPAIAPPAPPPAQTAPPKKETLHFEPVPMAPR